MKSLCMCLGLWMMSVAVCFAEEAADRYERHEPPRVTDAEGVIILNTVNSYVEAKGGRIELLDRKKGKVVTLKLDRVVGDDPDRVVYTRVDRIAVCGECTEIGADGEPTGDRYEVWFVLQRGSAMMSRVLETVIKSVNGNPMYSWRRDKYGQWTAELVPDPE